MMNKLVNIFCNKKVSSREIIPVVHCFDNNYVVPAAVSFFSMLKNANPKFDYKLYVLHTDITPNNQHKLARLVNSFGYASLQFINMKNKFEDIWVNMQNKGHYSKDVLYKLLIPSIFPNHRKVIVTDVDVVFTGDISSSYLSINPHDNVYLAGVKHVAPKNSWLEDYYKGYNVFFGDGAADKLKVCGGYLVMNLDKLREDKMEQIFIDYLKKNAARLLQAEQDVINFCCKERFIKYLPLRTLVCNYFYDVFSSEEACLLDRNHTKKEILAALKSPIQLHYATGKKPWNDSTVRMFELWLLYLFRTPFFDEYMCMEIAKKYPPNVASYVHGIINQNRKESFACPRYRF